MRKLFAFSIATLVLSLGALPASSTTGTVPVHLRLALGGRAGVYKTCASLPVAPGSSGAVVLAAAQSRGCISSYSLSSNGAFVDCVDGICGQAGGLVTFWAYYKNNVVQESGIDTFAARSGDTMTLAYTNFLLCPLYPDCPL